MYRHNLLRGMLPILLIASLAACAIAPGPDEGSAPVIDQTAPGAPASPGVERTPPPRRTLTMIEPEPRPAVVEGLLDTAQRQLAAGDAAAAAATLERALRIAPKDPLLWQRLAAVRLAQGRWDLAEQMAAKSNTLAGDDRAVMASNWLLIGDARQGRGDLAGARRAREQARQASE